MFAADSTNNSSALNRFPNSIQAFSSISLRYENIDLESRCTFLSKSAVHSQGTRLTN
jgi:hypothetical protein